MGKQVIIVNFLILLFLNLFVQITYVNSFTRNFHAVSNSICHHFQRRSVLLQSQKNNKDSFFTIADIEEYAKVSGLFISITTTGPFLRLEAFPIIGDHELIGYLTAFIRPLPFGLFHLDTIRVKNRRQNLGYIRKNWAIDGPGISFILGSYALIWAFEKGCRTSQLLAVNDSPLMHAILIRLYQRYVLFYLVICASVFDCIVGQQHCLPRYCSHPPKFEYCMYIVCMHCESFGILQWIDS